MDDSNRADQLLPVPRERFPRELQTTADAAHEYFLDQHADATKRAYRSDWRIFEAWCVQFQIIGLPADAGAVALFLAAEAEKGTKYATIARRAAAIKYMHKLAGYESPTSSIAVEGTLKGIRRRIGIAPRKKAPATIDRIQAMIASCPDTLKGQRDRALLLFGFAGAFRRSELVALTVEDLTSVPEGVKVRIRKSKTDQEGAGQEIAIPNGATLRIAEAMKRWLVAAKITTGPIFRRISRKIGCANREDLRAEGWVGSLAFCGALVEVRLSDHCRRAWCDFAQDGGGLAPSLIGYATGLCTVCGAFQRARGRRFSVEGRISWAVSCRGPSPHS